MQCGWWARAGQGLRTAGRRKGGVKTRLQELGKGVTANVWSREVKNHSPRGDRRVKRPFLSKEGLGSDKWESFLTGEKKYMG